LEERLAHLLEEVEPHTLFHVGPVEVTSSVVNMWAAMVVLAALLWLLTRKLDFLPRGAQTLLELLVEFIWGITDPLMGHHGRKYLPVIGTFFVFILFLNFAWFIPGVIPPTSDLSVTAGLAVTAIILVQVIAIRELGLRKYVGRFFKPFPPMVLMNLIEQVVRPFSLALRLFGNLFGEELVVGAFAALIPLFVPVPIMLLGLIFGFIQALVFTTLTATYIAEAVEEEH